MNVITPNLKWNGTLTPLNLKTVKFIVVHHIEAANAKIEDIHKWHLDNKWSGCGYNEYIKKDGTVYIGRGDNIGAHTMGYNDIAYGIALEGDYAKEKIMHDAQYKALVERLLYHVLRLTPNVNIVGHKELTSTECPANAMYYLTMAIKEVYAKMNETKQVTNIDEALKLLTDKKIISSPDYWRKACDVVTYLKDFVINVAKFINLNCK